MSDTPELTRYSVLQTALLAELLTAIGLSRTDPGLASILKELDALTMVLTHRCRSAIGYHETDRGRAALEDAERILAAAEQGQLLRDPETGEVWVSWETRRWSLEQASGPMYPGMKPEKVIEHARDVRGVTLLSFDTPEPVLVDMQDGVKPPEPPPET